jgi:hypothetical protein
MCLTGARTASLIPLKAFKMLNPKLYLMAFESILFLIKLLIIKSQFSFSFLFYFISLPFFINIRSNLFKINYRQYC